jgi:flagellar basal-body rod modification protein FlgD
MNINPAAADNTTRANPATGSNSSSGSTPSSSGSNILTGENFMSLLTVQLKDQDPMNPTDPTTFVAQMVSFNTLQQIIQLRQDVESALGGVKSQSNPSSDATNGATARGVSGASANPTATNPAAANSASRGLQSNNPNSHLLKSRA